jgi:hypothetical protein
MTRPSENVGFTGATIRGVVAQRVTSGGWRSPNSSRQRSSRTLPPPSTRSCLFLSLPLFHPPPPSLKLRSLFFSLPCRSLSVSHSRLPTGAKRGERYGSSYCKSSCHPPHNPHTHTHVRRCVYACACREREGREHGRSQEVCVYACACRERERREHGRAKETEKPGGRQRYRVRALAREEERDREGEGDRQRRRRERGRG